MLTKERIEALDQAMYITDDFAELMSDEEVAELRRLALLGLERDTRAERIGLAVLKWRETAANAERIIRCVWAAMPHGNVLRAIAAAMEDAT